MIKILKRLELIKTAITIEDEEIIGLQITKLEMLDIDDQVKNILEMVENSDYGNVAIAIDDYLERFSGMVMYEDKEIQGLRLELKILEQKLQDLSDDKNEHLHNIEEFNAEYNLKLGAMIREILELREKILSEQLKNVEENNEEELKEAHKEAKQDYKQFNKEYEEQIKEQPFELTDDERIALKKAYRKASRMCHPDIVSEDMKEQAEKIFIELTEAYKKNDLSRVEEILANLENGYGFEAASNKINDAGILRRKIDELRNKIIEAEEEIEIIFQDETYQTINEIDDWDEYFETMKIDLKEEVGRLQEVLDDAHENSSEDNEDEEYWDMLLGEMEDEYEVTDNTIDESEGEEEVSNGDSIKEKFSKFSDKTLDGIDGLGVPCRVYFTRGLMEFGFQAAGGGLVTPVFHSFNDEGGMNYVARVVGTEVLFKLIDIPADEPTLQLSLYEDDDEMLTVKLVAID